MKTAILIHGWPDKEEYFDPKGPSSSNRQWLPWLQHQLLINGILAQTPEMPDVWEPNYEKWKGVFEHFPINEETILIGHSCGAGFLVRWLSENKVKVGKVFLVAPWIDPDHQERESVGDFFDFKIDESLKSRTDDLCIFYSIDDDQPMIDSVGELEIKIKDIRVEEYKDQGHFTTGDMGTDEFPDLLAKILE